MDRRNEFKNMLDQILVEIIKENAAVAVKGRAANGWINWKYQESPGVWVLLDTLRK